MNQKAQRKEIKRLTKALSQKDRVLCHLKRENAALKRQISALKRNADANRSSSLPFSQKQDKRPTDQQYHELMSSAVTNARRFSKRSYLGYLAQSVKESDIGILFRRITRFWRRLRLFRTVTAVVAAILAALLVSAVFVTVIPFFILFSLVTMMAVFLRARATGRKMAEKLTNKRIRIVILSDGVNLGDNTFAERSARAMASQPNTAVLVITPYFVSTRGLGGRGMFFTVREEAEDLYLVRRCYYFLLRRQVLDAVCEDVTVMY